MISLAGPLNLRHLAAKIRNGLLGDITRVYKVHMSTCQNRGVEDQAYDDFIPPYKLI